MPHEALPKNTPALDDDRQNDRPPQHHNAETGVIRSNRELEAKTDEQKAPGMATGLKELYRPDERHSWDDWCPDDIATSADDPAITAKYAVVVRKQPDRSGKGGLMLHSITVQSPLIRKVLSKVFEDFRGLSTKPKDLTFTHPFREFFYRWDSFHAHIAACKDHLTIEHMEILREVVVPQIQPHIDTRDDLVKHGLISYAYLWALFEPGMEIYAKVNKHDRIFLLSETRYEEEFFRLSCRYVDYNGKDFGYISTSMTLRAFDGVIPISELDVLPAQFHSDPDLLRTRLWNRGKTFENLAGVHYKGYTGQYIPKRTFSFGSNERLMESGRIIIDAKLFYEYSSSKSPHLSSLPGSTIETIDVREAGYMELLRRMQYPMPKPTQFEPTSSSNGKAPVQVLSELEYRLCTPQLRGFALSFNEWSTFYVDCVHDITFSIEAFPRLVLPFDYKELILAFVASQLSCNDTFDDIIQGKGEGMIILLHGEPGVGKTLTAEATAEEMRKPLYIMSAGELGYSAGEVEDNLRKVLQISTKWGAVLLIDECDIFLEQRTISDMERNKLVAVFLRVLEYFKGLMFLTTNRIGTFDAAFQSRIHLTINYPALGFDSRKHVWRTFVPGTSKDATVEHTPKHAISDADIHALASIELNGREIKNIVKSATLLSTSKRLPLSMSHIHTVLRVKGIELADN